ncbi:non-homologous end-joining factor 1 isoform X4 [Gadus morhua]|uniref:non-homologous end-joining factor 1 isoform X4 n=1 Tax=Gadus morhua TaxID=8049 RepID=UPI0011B44604|nr:non-homologous end-joining factor 1 isoform X4 [Gadus morhua]
MKRSHPPSPPRRKQVNSNSLSSSPAQMEDRGLTAGEALSRQPWLPVCIGKDQLLAKAWFGDLAYHILLTDTRAVWAESMDSAAIQRRAQELNKRLRAPVEAFYSHLRDVALPCLSGPLGEGEVPAGGGAPEEGGATVTLTRPGSGTVAGGGVCVRLKSELAGLPFHWEFRLASPPADTVCSELVRPLLVMSRLLQTQVDQLGALLARKDAQIQDYRETGATLSRAPPPGDVRAREGLRLRLRPEGALLRRRRPRKPGQTQAPLLPLLPIGYRGTGGGACAEPNPDSRGRRRQRGSPAHQVRPGRTRS